MDLQIADPFTADNGLECVLLFNGDNCEIEDCKMVHVQIGPKSLLYIPSVLFFFSTISLEQDETNLKMLPLRSPQGSSAASEPERCSGSRQLKTRNASSYTWWIMSHAFISVSKSGKPYLECRLNVFHLLRSLHTTETILTVVSSIGDKKAILDALPPVLLLALISLALISLALITDHDLVLQLKEIRHDLRQVRCDTESMLFLAERCLMWPTVLPESHALFLLQYRFMPL